MTSLIIPHRPDVSIIMPVFNKLELTKICVDSLWDIGARATWELIIVDNGSSDGSEDWLKDQEKAGRLRYIKNLENKGFAQGCNVGAAASKGKYILFLNNDMEVLPGWLDPMVTTLDNDKRVGIAGAKLLFPDLTIQHAGVALVENRDNGNSVLEGFHLSYKKPADTKGTRSPQKMQIVTGACLMIRPEAFLEAGGFDEQYWNGNEDVDLCLKVGQNGWQTVYRPESVIIHHESQSGPERWAKVQPNIEYFNTVWQNKAKPDYIRYSDDSLESTENNCIGHYESPRIKMLPSQSNHTTGNSEPKEPVVSVVVLTWNALKYTKLCAESLLAHTAKHHELIFVDNGSQSDTIDYLLQLDREHNQVKVIFNHKNLGFAAGNNVGIAAAKGDFICLLNSDTVVTENWLTRLVAPAIADPNIGLVGPVTNRISGNQCLKEVGYNQDSLSGMTEFAAARAEQFKGVSNPAVWLVGFCLLIRNDLIERIGGLDEGFGQGNYEDNDYCLRAMLATYGSLVVQDCFVHHFGSRSFLEAKVDYSKQIDEKFNIFCDKWHVEDRTQGLAGLNLKLLVAIGYVSPLHYHPLPHSNSVQVLPIQKWDLDRWLAKGELVFQAGMLDQAESIFRAIVASVKDCSQAESNLACTLWQQAKNTKEISETQAKLTMATKILKGILDREPDNQDAQWNLEEIKMDLKVESYSAQ